MKKKKSIKTKKKMPKQQKIDIVLESLLNLETVVKELIKRVETLQYSLPYYPPYSPKDNNKYWPNTEPPFKYKDIMWNDNDTRQWDAIEKGLQ